MSQICAAVVKSRDACFDETCPEAFASIKFHLQCCFFLLHFQTSTLCLFKVFLMFFCKRLKEQHIKKILEHKQFF